MGKPVTASIRSLAGGLCVALSALGLMACAPEVVRRPTQLTRVDQAGGTIEILETASVTVGPGYRREVRRGSVWTRVGRSVAHSVARTLG